MNINMQKQNGFTLIELVVVIIILGILAVTAAPKFINLQSDARASALQGVKGAIQGANGLVFAKAALGGDERKPSTSWTAASAGTPAVVGTGVDIGAANLAKTNYGYLQATMDELNNAIDVNLGAASTDDWVVVEGTNVITITQKGAPKATGTAGVTGFKACQLAYTQATSNAIPTYVITDNGC